LQLTPFEAFPDQSIWYGQLQTGSVLWFQLSRRPGDGADTMARVAAGRCVATRSTAPPKPGFKESIMSTIPSIATRFTQRSDKSSA
jgi:hypothetical protein